MRIKRLILVLGLQYKGYGCEKHGLARNFMSRPVYIVLRYVPRPEGNCVLTLRYWRDRNYSIAFFLHLDMTISQRIGKHLLRDCCVG